MTPKEEFMEYINQYNRSGDLARFQRQLIERWGDNQIEMWNIMIECNVESETIINDKLDQFGIRNEPSYRIPFEESVELHQKAMGHNFTLFCQMGDSSAVIAQIISSCSNRISAQDVRGPELNEDNLNQVLVQYREIVEIHKRLLVVLGLVSIVITDDKTAEHVLQLEDWIQFRQLFEIYKTGTGDVFVWHDDHRLIRNSISHGTVYPNLETETIRFVDRDKEKIGTFDELVDIFNFGVNWMMAICLSLLHARTETFQRMIQMSS